ncbi:aspartate aminotransferase family protein [Intestinibacillus sp. Marseille-P6563]|uniref:aspartate aminotransferase family protein n=1 Tax=Intestinibacillus sp. Marseille-P6563 TaxID=2364792 RepID=UPI000F06BC4F|nr:aspartate aminotransferase family protein [Intestinibacillus sp. Marseille-P6563]
MKYQELKAQEQQYVMNTYGRFPIALDHGQGAVLWDVEGKKYIDLASGIGVCSVGYNNEKLVAAIDEQAHKLMHVSNLFTTAPMIQTAKTLVEATGMGKVFFSNSGAESNEGAIKLARKYSFDKYGKGRSKIVTLINSFHGRTVTTLNATGQDKFHNYFFPFTEGFDYAVANDIEDVKAKADDTTCAIMMELIQGEGGVLPLEPAFVKAVEAFCRERDLLLIIDEVQTGIGRTGSLFCFQQYDIQPDVVTTAKGIAGGLPMGAVIAAKTCCDVLGPGTHATTFGGTPTCCAAANAVLDIVNQPEFLQEVNKKGEYLKQGILNLGSDQIQGVRGKGLMLGIIVDPEKRAELVNACLDKGVLVLTAGTAAIRLLPPLTITYEEMDEALAILKTVF